MSYFIELQYFQDYVHLFQRQTESDINTTKQENEVKSATDMRKCQKNIQKIVQKEQLFLGCHANNVRSAEKPQKR